MAKKIVILEDTGFDCYLHKTKCDGKFYGFRDNQPEEIKFPLDKYVINDLNPSGVHIKTPGLGQLNNTFVIETGRFIATGPIVNGQYALTKFDFDSDYIRMIYSNGYIQSGIIADINGIEFINVSNAVSTAFVYVENNEGYLRKITIDSLSQLLQPIDEHISFSDGFSNGFN